MDTRLATVSALASACCAEIRSRSRRGRPLPLLADSLAWTELDSLVGWGSAEPASLHVVETTIADAG